MHNNGIEFLNEPFPRVVFQAGLKLIRLSPLKIVRGAPAVAQPKVSLTLLLCRSRDSLPWMLFIRQQQRHRKVTRP